MTSVSSPLKRFQCLNAFQLKCLAMFFMLCDHTWGTVAVQFPALTAIGRLAFPIFAFQIAEGFCLTHDRKRYLKRMFLFALLSEIPFNLMVSGGPIDPMDQNVLFTFCLALLAMMPLEWAKKKGKAPFLGMLIVVLPVSYLVGFITMVDYYGYGILMVLVFYLFREARFGWIWELVCLFYINWEMIGGLVYEVPVFGHTWILPEQGIAVLSLLLIWLYNGRQGPHSKKIQYACYAFYPVHITLLFLLSLLLYS